MSSSDLSDRFSRRTGWPRVASEVASGLARSRLKDRVLLDLTQSNPTTCGLLYDANALLSPLAADGALRYAPESEGLLSARQAIAEYYRGRGATISPEQVLLTASTSEGYSHLFRLLCNAGDEVLIAQPGYPLFDYLADLSDVTLKAFPLFHDHGWWMDSAELERAITSRTRAIIVVDPNNPTGHTTSPAERRRLQELCLRHGLSLVVDEVFLDFAHEGEEAIVSFASEETAVLTFVLNGLSKVAALPQMKVAWMVVLGAPHERAEALDRLRIVADTFLSVSTPAQLAVPMWLQQAPLLQQQIRARIADNLNRLRRGRVSFYPVHAGWTAMLRLPRTFSQETAAAALLEQGVLTHPAHFYGLEDAACVVVSLIVPAETMHAAVGRMEPMLCPQ